MMFGEGVVAARLAPPQAQTAAQVGIGRLPSAGKAQHRCAALLDFFGDDGLDFLHDALAQRQQQKPAARGWVASTLYSKVEGVLPSGFREPSIITLVKPISMAVLQVSTLLPWSRCRTVGISG